MRKIVILIIILFALSIPSIKNFADDKNTAQVIIHNSQGKTIVVKTEEVFGEKAIKGLSGRQGLPTNGGMLFDQNKFYKEWNSEQRKEAKNLIWMSDMNFSIDIIWIDDGKIIHTIEYASIPYKNHVSYYGVSGHCDYVLEVNSGFVRLHNITVGDRIEIKK